MPTDRLRIRLQRSRRLFQPGDRVHVAETPHVLLSSATEYFCEYRAKAISYLNGSVLGARFWDAPRGDVICRHIFSRTHVSHRPRNLLPLPSDTRYPRFQAKVIRPKYLQVIESFWIVGKNSFSHARGDILTGLYRAHKITFL